MERKILIIIDNSGTLRDLADSIAASIKNLPSKGTPSASYSVSVMEADHLSAVDLLPANAFFLGCEKPRSFSFSYVEDLFAHINLAGRFCGIFSTNFTAIKYLSSLVRSSEVTVSIPPLGESDYTDHMDLPMKLQNWAVDLIKGGNK